MFLLFSVFPENTMEINGELLLLYYMYRYLYTRSSFHKWNGKSGYWTKPVHGSAEGRVRGKHKQKVDVDDGDIDNDRMSVICIKLNISLAYLSPQLNT